MSSLASQNSIIERIYSTDTCNQDVSASKLGALCSLTSKIGKVIFQRKLWSVQLQNRQHVWFRVEVLIRTPASPGDDWPDVCVCVCVFAFPSLKWIFPLSLDARTHTRTHTFITVLLNNSPMLSIFHARDYYSLPTIPSSWLSCMLTGQNCAIALVQQSTVRVCVFAGERKNIICCWFMREARFNLHLYV